MWYNPTFIVDIQFFTKSIKYTTKPIVIETARNGEKMAIFLCEVSKKKAHKYM